jgi:hypothetical protein
MLNDQRCLFPRRHNMISIKILISIVLLGLMVIEVYALDSQSSNGVSASDLNSSNGADLGYRSLGAPEANSLNATDQNGNLAEEKPVVILSPERGNNDDSYTYTIFPPLNVKPPQLIVLTWTSPKISAFDLNSSDYIGGEFISRNAAYWKDYEPVVISMQIPNDYYNKRFVGSILGDLKIGSKSYGIQGPYVESFTRENITQLENGSWSYNFQIASESSYQICPTCDYGKGPEQKGNMSCRFNAPRKDVLLTWLIPKENGVPNTCRSSMIPRD